MPNLITRRAEADLQAKRSFGTYSAVIMCRRSYDKGIAAWGGKGPLGEVPCFVVTHAG